MKNVLRIAALALLAIVTPTLAQSYPNQPIRLIVAETRNIMPGSVTARMP